MFDREKVSLLLSSSGLLRALELLPPAPGLIVFNHHRIGNRLESDFDRELFSASPEQFDLQLSYIKRNFPVLLPRELLDLTANEKPLNRLYAMITFDDGYLDNYTHALPLLKRHGLSAAFYLTSSFTGSNVVPWWDEVAFLVRHSPSPSLRISAQPGVSVTLDADRAPALRQVLQAYKSEQNNDPDAFMRELREQSQVTLPPQNRRFLNWDEAREMADAGMEIGAHTHTHPFLSRLSYAQQEFELRDSKTLIEKNLGMPVASLAYPNGTLSDFSSDTQRIAKNAGYTSAFSFYGGINPAVISDPFNIFRITPNALPGSFRFDSILATRFGKLEPSLRNAYRRIRYGSQAA